MKKAFTLIELLVVIAIITILAAMLFPVFSRVREKARQASCASNEKQLGLALMQYTQDFDEVFPFAYLNSTSKSWKDVLNPYTKSNQIFLCPSNSLQDSNISYAANTCNGYNYGNSPSNLNGVMGYQDNYGIMDPARLSQIADGATLICIAETNWTNNDFQPGNSYYSGANGAPGAPTNSISLFAGHQGRSNYLFADGHVKALLPFQTVGPTENGTAGSNYWRRDGKPYTDFGPYDPQFTASQAVFKAASNYYQ